MSDPLSVAAGVVGILNVTIHLGLTLGDVIKRAKNAPEDCNRLQSEVQDIQNVLQQLSQYLNGSKIVSRSRRALIMVDQVATTLASCITTFDELNAFVESLRHETSMGILDRLRWLTKSNDLKQFLARTETHKSSLMLTLAILTCQKQDDAEEKVEHLYDMIELILKQNTLIAERMAAYDMSQLESIQANRVKINANSMNAFDETRIPALDTMQRNTKGFAFEEVLMNSRAYRAIRRDSSDAFSKDNISMISSIGRTATWSALSGLSLSELSNIAILAIPIYQSDIKNDLFYNFSLQPGAEDLPGANTDLHHEDVLPAKVPSADVRSSKGRKEWWKSFQKREKLQHIRQHEQKQPNQLVFGVHIAESIRYANAAINLRDENGDPFFYGYIPIVVAKVGVFIKEKGVEKEHVFTRDGHIARVNALQKLFDSPDRYGKGLDWTGFTVFDATTVLLRYLRSIPEPVVPFSMYDRFREPLSTMIDGSEAEIQHVTIPKYQRLIVELPPLNRHMLLYILDILAVVASKADVNKMTVPCIAIVFRHVILSGPDQHRSMKELRLNQDVLEFLIERIGTIEMTVSGANA